MSPNMCYFLLNFGGLLDYVTVYAHTEVPSWILVLISCVGCTHGGAMNILALQLLLILFNYPEINYKLNA
jgi:hypothetical protein